MIGITAIANRALTLDAMSVSGNILATADEYFSVDGNKILQIVPKTKTTSTVYSFPDTTQVLTAAVDAAGNIYGVANILPLTSASSIESFYIRAGDTHAVIVDSFSGYFRAPPGNRSFVADNAGDLYGVTTYAAGAPNGSVVRVDAHTGHMTTVAVLDGTAGFDPIALATDSSGTLYVATNGTTQTPLNWQGYILQVDPKSGAVTPLHRFTEDEGFRADQLVVNSSGQVFGLTSFSVFSLDPVTHNPHELHHFSQQASWLIIDAAGDLFIGTYASGGGGNGDVYEIAAGTHTVTALGLPTFARGLEKPLVDAAGNFYAASSGTWKVTGTGYVPYTLGLSSTGGLTNQAHQTITGHADSIFANALLTICEGTHVLGGGIVAADGNFSADIILSGQGEHDLFAVLPGHGTGLLTSAAVAFTLDTIKPKVAITPPATITIQPHQTITGTGEASTTVSLYDNNMLLGTTTVDGSGHWSLAITLSGGNHTLQAKDTDAAGNVGASAKVQDHLLVPSADGTISTNLDWHLTDADLAGITGLNRIGFTGTGSSSVVLGANAEADGAGKFSVTAAASVASLMVDGSAVSAATKLTLKGGNGDDSFIGGAGNDTFIGGGGHDVFDLRQGGRDTITDFDVTKDVLQMGGHAMADLHITYSHGNAYLRLDATHQVVLGHVAAGSLNATDFIFT